MAQVITQQGKKYSYEKRLEVVQKYLLLGNMRLVGDLTGVTHQTIRLWKTQEWWKDLVAEIRSARNITLDNKMSELVDRSLDLVGDRLERGEMYFDVKSQEWSRRPVNLQAALKATDVLLNQQNILSKKESQQTQQEAAATVSDQIKNLALEFAKFNTKRTVDVVAKEIYAVHDERETGLQEATEVRWEAGTDQEAGREECGQSGDGEGGASAQGGWEGRGSQDTAEQGWASDGQIEPESDISTHESFFQPKL